MSPDRGENSTFSPRVDGHSTSPTSTTSTTNPATHHPTMQTSTPAEVPGGEATTNTAQETAMPASDARGSHNSSNQSSTRPSSPNSSSSSNSRRDSGYSTHAPRKRTRKISRSSSKQSLQLGPGMLPRDNGSRPHLGRVISSPNIRQPRNNIQEALALHERSCRIFPPSSAPPMSALGPGQANEVGPGSLFRSKTSPDLAVRSQARPKLSSRTCTAPMAGGLTESTDLDDNVPEEEQYVPATIIHWTSDETRRKEYAEIDNESKGLRGLLNRLFPRLRGKSKRSRFYDVNEGSQAGSVRRFRLDLDDDNGQRGGR